MAEETVDPKKELADATKKLREEQEKLTFAHSEEGKEVRRLERETNALGKARSAIADEEEKRLQKWGDLTKELKDGLFAPFKSMLSAIPAPLLTLGKMAGFGLKKLTGRGKPKELKEDEKQTGLLEQLVTFLRPRDKSKANEAAIEAGEDGGDTTVIQGNQTIKKGGFLRSLLGGLLGSLGGKGGIGLLLGSMFVAAGAALLKGIGVVFAGLKALGMLALPVAIIAYGLYSAIQIVKDWVAGYKTGGISGAIGQALGGSGEGWGNAFKQGGKWAGVGALAGFMVAGPVGALVGGIAGMALGALFGFIGGAKIKKWLDGAGKTASEAWDKLKAWAGNLVDAVAAFIYTPGGKEQGPPGTGDLSVPTVMGVHWAGLWDNISGRVSDAWTSLKEMISNLVTATGKFFYDPQIEIDEYGKTLSKGPVKIFGVALGPLWENITQRVTDSWNGLKSYVNGIVQSVADFIWTPGEAYISPEDELIKEPGKLFGIQLPTLDDISMLVYDRWQSLMKWINDKVNAVATFIWDEKNDKLFGFEIPEIRMPEFNMPDFSAILEGIKQKFTGSVADMLSNIPKWALPAAAEEWIAANTTTTSQEESSISSPKRARTSLASSSQSLFDAQVSAESKVGLDAFGGAGMAQTLSQAFTPGAGLPFLEGTGLNRPVGEVATKLVEGIMGFFSGGGESAASMSDSNYKTSSSVAKDSYKLGQSIWC